MHLHPCNIKFIIHAVQQKGQLCTPHCAMTFNRTPHPRGNLLLSWLIYGTNAGKKMMILRLFRRTLKVKKKACLTETLDDLNTTKETKLCRQPLWLNPFVGIQPNLFSESVHILNHLYLQFKIFLMKVVPERFEE